MLAQSIRATRQSAALLARQHAPSVRRAFASSSFRRGNLADMVQDMYLREVKNYKIPQPKPSDAEGHVQKFNTPKPPKAPEDGDLANDLKAYESQEVEIEGQQSGDSGAESHEHKWFEDEALEDKQGEGAHH